MRQSYNPIRIYLDGYDWTGRTSRPRLFVVYGVWALVAAPLLLLDVFGAGARLVEVTIWVALSMLVVPVLGHTVRRLNEMRWPFWVIALLFVPYVSTVVMLVVLLKGQGQRRLYEMTPLRMAAYVLAFGLAAVAFSRIAWSPYTIVAGSMKPTLYVGDVIAVNRLSRHPDRGDVIAFRPDGSTDVYLKRVIGLPGDEVQIADGRVVVNGITWAQSTTDPFLEPMVPQGPLRLLPRCANGAVGQGATCRKEQLIETNQDGHSYEVLDILPAGPQDATEIYRVPVGRYFVLGDNRDNSADSRIAVLAGGVGMVSQGSVVGRAVRILYSFEGQSPALIWNWRLGRFLKAVR
ncbi:signal peptidase I [Marivivens donghaensis]|jgi:signal peptidase I|uniref:signal peptidase I n=1 Tax=Marivivens donghaensis TaxID=1699413 RepID=UPI003F6994CC